MKITTIIPEITLPPICLKSEIPQKDSKNAIDIVKAPANIRRRLLVQLPGYIFLTEPHEHDRRLGAGGLALGAESGAVAGAVDDSSAHGPLHGGDGILTEIGHIRIGQDIGVLTDGHIIALLLDIVWFKPYGKSMILFIRTFHQPGGSVLRA